MWVLVLGWGETRNKEAASQRDLGPGPGEQSEYRAGYRVCGMTLDGGVAFGLCLVIEKNQGARTSQFGPHIPVGMLY